MTSESRKKIVIMGGGPAGVFCACSLVELGYHVTLITRPRPFPAWEGLSERPCTSLRHFGFNETLDSIGPMVVRFAHWNGQSIAQNREYIVDRRKFDRALLQDAENKGVEVIDGRIDRVEREKENWIISYTGPDGGMTCHADFLVEARGRESKIGRQLSAGEGDFTSGPARFLSIVKRANCRLKQDWKNIFQNYVSNCRKRATGCGGPLPVMTAFLSVRRRLIKRRRWAGLIFWWLVMVRWPLIPCRAMVFFTPLAVVLPQPR